MNECGLMDGMREKGEGGGRGVYKGYTDIRFHRRDEPEIRTGRTCQFP